MMDQNNLLKAISIKSFFLSIFTLIAFSACSKDEPELTPAVPESTTNNTVTFTYNNEEVVYGIVSYAGHTWMDRNLGAARRATAIDDAESFGDKFQWGREADGHQFSTSQSTDTLVTTPEQPGHDRFIVAENSPYDWNTNTEWNTRWTDSNGIKTEADPCPCGWRVPTIDEWNAAISAGNWENRSDAYQSALKLPSAGLRNHANELGFTKTEYWSSTYSGASSAHRLSMEANTIDTGGGTTRSGGLSIRCIKDN